MTRGRPTPPQTRAATKKAAVLADYAAGMSQHGVAKKHGVAKSTVYNWVKAAGISRNLTEAKDVELADLRARKAAEEAAAAAKLEAEITLTGGEWAQDGLVQRWQPFVAPSKRNLSDRARRVEWEDATVSDLQARAAHARFVAGDRDDETLLGEKVYQRRMKRQKRAEVEAA